MYDVRCGCWTRYSMKSFAKEFNNVCCETNKGKLIGTRNDKDHEKGGTEDCLVFQSSNHFNVIPYNTASYNKTFMKFVYKMKHSDIKNVIESRFEKIEDSWDKIIKHFDMEEIHDFRVEVKKLRAFMRLAATALASPVELKIPFHLKSLYRSAGNIRTLQLQQQRIFQHVTEKKFREPTQYLQILLDQQRYWERKIPEISNRKALETEEEMLILTFNSKLGKESVKKYTETRTRELRDLLTVREHSDERLHQIRKILKDIMYTLPYTGDYFFSFFNNRLQSKEDLKSLTDILGEIQDASTSLQFLLPEYIKEVTDPEEISSIQTIREEWTLQKADKKNVVCENLAQIGME